MQLTSGPLLVPSLVPLLSPTCPTGHRTFLQARPAPRADQPQSRVRELFKGWRSARSDVRAQAGEPINHPVVDAVEPAPGVLLHERAAMCIQ